MSSMTLPEPGAADPQRRTWLLATSAAGGVAAVATAVPFVSSFAPSERARAMGAAVEVDIGDIPPGGMKTVEWRGKPVWIVRRTPEMLAALRGTEAELADPNSQRDQQPEYARNAARSVRPEVFVAVGICTHLGCSPTHRAGRRRQPQPAGRLAGRLLLPVPRLHLRRRRPGVQEQAGTDQSGDPAAPVPRDTRLLIGEDSRSA